MPVTLHFQTTGLVPGNARPIAMLGRSLTIGRGDENDLVLPDPDRTVSKRHCAIEDHGGNTVVIDLSTNGTFLNYGKLPLGRGPTPLNDGDILTIGPYELMVEIPQARRPDPLADLPPPVAQGPVSPGNAARAAATGSLIDDPAGDDFLDSLLGPSPGGPARVKRAAPGDDGLLPPLGADDLGIFAPPPEPEPRGASRPSHSPAVEDHFAPPRPAAQAIPDDWDEDLLAPGGGGPGGSADDPFAAPAATVPPPDPGPRPAPAPRAAIPPIPDAPEPAPRPAAQVAGTGDAAARAFLKTLGAGDLAIADDELLPTLSRLGHVLRIMIHGVREVLMTRTAIKSEFRINQTMIAAGGNNPLKFSISPEQAVEAMAKPSTRGYLDAAEAADQALRDIKAHEIAVMTGMQAAMKGILARLDPQVLAGRIETSGGIGSILKGRKARYWEVYEQMYAEISDQAEKDFHELFSKEFARAYQEQIDRLK
jgi:type VI secretion system FHA domain protein